MIEVFPNINIVDADIPRKAKVAYLWNSNGWSLPDPIDDYTHIAWQEISQVNLHANSQNTIRWKFSTSG